MKKPSCATCVYCQRESAECRFSAPEALSASSITNAVSNYAIWPKVMLDGTYWCGHWRNAAPPKDVLGDRMGDRLGVKHD